MEIISARQNLFNSIIDNIHEFEDITIDNNDNEILFYKDIEKPIVFTIPEFLNYVFKYIGADSKHVNFV